MDEERFDELATATDPAMAVVTTVAGGQRSGCLVGFHGQTSIEPRRYGVWISKANHTYGVVLEASHVAVHLLGSHDHDLADAFGSLTGDEVDKFSLVEVHDGPGGVPILDRSAHGLVGTKAALLDEGGDHVLVTLDPVEVWSRGTMVPLRLSDVDDVEPAHPPEERSDGS